MPARPKTQNGTLPCLARSQSMGDFEPRSESGCQADASTQEERLMRLNEAQVQKTLSQMDAHVLPEDHPVAAQLADLFGDHTFFLDQNGLKVLEPTESETETGEVVSLADWADSTLTRLTPHAPDPT